MAQKLRRNLATGYTLLELMLCISIITVLTGISFISVAAPQQLLAVQSQRIEAHRILTQVRLASLLAGRSITLSITPWIWWRDEQKALILAPESGWRWQTELSKINWNEKGQFSLINTQGQEVGTPQTLRLTYNQKEKFRIEFDPQSQRIQVH
jgi:prepilin-type N-terminal cleavage/methylation domain-containing protein